MKTRALTRRRLMLAAGAAAALPRLTAAAQPPAPSAWAQLKQYRTVDGVRMAYYEAGRGDPIVFLHGNPTSSYLWRKVIPHVQHLGRCIAPDLVGMGDSQKLPDSGPGVYTYRNHRRYLDGLLAALGVERNVVFVIHDWGSALGFDWASGHPESVRGLAYMEAILRPPGPENPAVQPTGIFARLRSPDGERMVLEDNVFVDKMLLAEVGLYLSDEDRAEYRRPFLEPGESRRPTLTWPRELCFGGEPEENCEIIRRYSAWLANSGIPKLFIRSEPGAIFRVKPLLKFARSLPNQKEVTVFGGHFVQEISGDAIGRALADWLPTLPA